MMFALLAQQCLGGLAFPIAKYGLMTIEPFTFAFFRFVIAAVVLLVITRLRKSQPPIEKKDYIKLIGLGALIVPFNQVAYLFGQQLTSASHAALLFATVPIWIFIAAMIHLGEKFVLRRGIGVVLGLVGVLIIIGGGAVEIESRYLWGDLIVLGAVLAWAYYTILGKSLVVKYGAFRVTAYALSSGAVLYLPFGIYRACSFDYSGVTVTAFLPVLYMALDVSVAAYVLWYWLLKQMEASRLAVFNNFQPLIAGAAGVLFLGEQVGVSLVIGGLVVLIGVIITETANRKKRIGNL